MSGKSHWNGRRVLTCAVFVIAAFTLWGCNDPQSLGPLFHQTPNTVPKPLPLAKHRAAPEVANPTPFPAPATSHTVRGSGVFVDASAPRRPLSSAETPTGDITLNFVNADVREVLPRVLGDILHLNFTIDPKVQAKITIQTSRPLRQQDVLGVLEEVLQTSGLTLVEHGGVYRLVQSDDAAHSGSVPVTVGNAGTVGGVAGSPAYNVQILPLRFISAAELEHTLTPFVPKSVAMQVDTTRNMLILSGTTADLATVTDMVRAFDVNWIRGMSFSIVAVETASPKSIVDQLTTIFGPKGPMPLPGMLNFQPLDRMSAVLVVTSQRAYLEQARQWIERLDRGETEARPRIYEYHVQNSRAADLAKVLTGLLSNGQVSTVQAQVAPGQAAVQIGQDSLGGAGGMPGATSAGSLSSSTGGGLASTTGSPGAATMNSILAQANGGPGTSGTQQNGTPPAEPLAQAMGGSSNANGMSLPVRIVADEKNNTLVIYAKPSDYRIIADALPRIDVVPLQVLVEATIAEVTLSNDLQYGLQYYFKANNNTFAFGSTTTPIGTPTTATVTTSAGTTVTAATQMIAPVFPGFNYIFAGNKANLVLNALSAITTVHVVSAPELLVLDHQSASLIVGNEIPIPTAQIQSTLTAGAPIVNTIQYVDTGVILKVSPRVNENGLITLDIGQEVSAVADDSSTAATNSLGPTISQRRIQSTITVQDGETVALGGLIQDSNSSTKNGLPILSDIPVIGPAFRSTDRSIARTELLVLLSPRVLHNANDARAATEELRSRLRAMDQKEPQLP